MDSQDDADPMYVGDDDYGFTWGSAVVSMAVHRLAAFRHRPRDQGPWLVLGVEITPSNGTHRHRKIEIHTSPSGHHIQIFLDGKELTP